MTLTCSLNLQQALVIALRYAAIRKQFASAGSKEEQELIEYQTHQYRLIPYIASCYVYQIFFYTLYDDFINFYSASVYGLDTGMNPVNSGAELHAISCSSKPVTSWVARDGIQECREACGGHGYLKASRFNELRNDHDANNTHEGDSHVILQQTSNYLMRFYDNKMQKGEPIKSPFGSVNFLNNIDQILQSKSPDNLQNVDNIVHIYQYLVSFLIVKSSQKLKQLIDQGLDTFTAKNECQIFLLKNLSIAFFECISLERFNNYCKQSEIPDDLSNILSKLAHLYGCWCLEKHLSTLTMANYLTNGAQLIDENRSTILKLCSQLKGESIALMDVLSPPDFILNSVLGYSDGKIYEHIFEAISKSDKSEERVNWYEEFTKFKPNISSIKSKL